MPDQNGRKGIVSKKVEVGGRTLIVNTAPFGAGWTTGIGVLTKDKSYLLMFHWKTEPSPGMQKVAENAALSIK